MGNVEVGPEPAPQALDRALIGHSKISSLFLRKDCKVWRVSLQGTTIVVISYNIVIDYRDSLKEFGRSRG